MSKFKVGDEVRAISKTSGDYLVNRLALTESELELLTTNKKNIMSTITKFVKDLGLSADEKLLRKYNLKTDYGDYTSESINVLLQDICKEREARLIEIANGLEAENKS